MAKVRLNSAGVAAMLGSAGTSAMLAARAEAALSAARASAPVKSGAYRDSLDVQVDTSGDRARARVVASAPHAMVVEASRGVLARALDAAGGS